ncbi:MAG: hypothetical protein Q7S35_03090 [Candidatus Limnocylindrales bacterium]|nr:hypothetical protein [Candidatus Limnocylindrales bacterium]
MADEHGHRGEGGFAARLAADRAERSRLPLKRDAGAFSDVILGLLFPQLAEEPASTPEEMTPA